MRLKNTFPKTIWYDEMWRGFRNASRRMPGWRLFDTESKCSRLVTKCGKFEIALVKSYANWRSASDLPSEEILKNLADVYPTINITTYSYQLQSESLTAKLKNSTYQINQYRTRKISLIRLCIVPEDNKHSFGNEFLLFSERRLEQQRIHREFILGITKPSAKNKDLTKKVEDKETTVKKQNIFSKLLSSK